MVDWKNPPRLFIPGPVKVNEDVLQQLARPTLGHRGKEYAQLHGETADMLKKILFTEQNVFLSTSSASGIWEAAIRNCVGFDETVLCTCCGAFSDKWADVARDCGRNVEELKVEVIASARNILTFLQSPVTDQSNSKARRNCKGLLDRGEYNVPTKLVKFHRQSDHRTYCIYKN